MKNRLARLLRRTADALDWTAEKIDPSPVPASVPTPVTSGYTCATCGRWIDPNNSHFHYPTASPNTGFAPGASFTIYGSSAS